MNQIIAINPVHLNDVGDRCFIVDAFAIQSGDSIVPWVLIAARRLPNQPPGNLRSRLPHRDRFLISLRRLRKKGTIPSVRMAKVAGSGTAFPVVNAELRECEEFGTAIRYPQSPFK